MTDERGDETLCCRCCIVPGEPDQCAFGAIRDVHSSWCPVCHPERADAQVPPSEEAPL